MATSAALPFCLWTFCTNGRLLAADGEPVINDVGLVALTLLVAESDPANKDVMIRLVMNMLAEPAG